MEHYTEIDKIKLAVYEEVARLALQEQLRQRIDELPFLIVEREQPTSRCCVYHERAVVTERIRLAMGLDRRKRRETERLSEVVDQALALDRPEEPMIVVIESACDACPIDRFMVTDACRNCMAHACKNVCPKQAIVIANQRAYIDQERCIECGKCAQACPFNAIAEVVRPCMRACGIGAIQGHRDRKTIIDYRKCVSCGHCIRACPFGAIADKSAIVQVIGLLKKEEPVYAAIAPSFIGQFGRGIVPEQLRAAFRQLGFADMIEVAIGADLVALEEAHELINEVPGQKPFAITTCCPSFRTLVEKHHSKIKGNLFDSQSPMVLTGQLIKEKLPRARVVFIGPCVAKKVEALQSPAREAIDAVLTFEEMMAIFKAGEINLAAMESCRGEWEASRTGRIFARSGGVTEALISTVKKINPTKEVNPVRVEGIKNCDKLLRTAEAGRLTNNLVEGMACTGGCVGGPGTMIKEVVATKLVNDYSQKSPYFYSLDNPLATKPKEK